MFEKLKQRINAFLNRSKNGSDTTPQPVSIHELISKIFEDFGGLCVGPLNGYCIRIRETSKPLAKFLLRYLKSERCEKLHYPNDDYNNHLCRYCLSNIGCLSETIEHSIKYGDDKRCPSQIQELLKGTRKLKKISKTVPFVFFSDEKKYAISILEICLKNWDEYGKLSTTHYAISTIAYYMDWSNISDDSWVELRQIIAKIDEELEE